MGMCPACNSGGKWAADVTCKSKQYSHVFLFSRRIDCIGIRIAMMYQNGKIATCSFLCTPLFQTALTWTMFKFTSPTYGDYVYPAWTSKFGWTLAAMSVVPFPIVTAIQLYTPAGLNFKQVRTSTLSFISHSPG